MVNAIYKSLNILHNFWLFIKLVEFSFVCHLFSCDPSGQSNARLVVTKRSKTAFLSILFHCDGLKWNQLKSSSNGLVWLSCCFFVLGQRETDKIYQMITLTNFLLIKCHPEIYLTLWSIWKNFYLSCSIKNQERR